MSVAYYNLSRGLLCEPPKDARYCFIMSTACERKDWERVLWQLPPDMFYHLARGEKVLVHDYSEKPRLTRAQWQGLSWIRFACNIAWYEVAPAEFARNGMHVSPYWHEQYAQLSRRMHTYLGRYREWAISDSAVRLEPCDCRLRAERKLAA